MSSVSFGLSKRKARITSKAAAFVDADQEEVDSPVISSIQFQAESERLQEQGNTQAAEGNLSGALGSWNRAIQLTPGRAVLHEQRAQVFLELGRAFDAVQSAERATQLQAEWAEAHITLSRAQMALGEPEIAMQSLETALHLEPDNEEATAELATIRVLVLQRRQMPGNALKQRVYVTSDGEKAQKR